MLGSNLRIAPSNAFDKFGSFSVTFIPGLRFFDTVVIMCS
jgi:hypothetical protein